MQSASTSYAGVPGADLANAPAGPVPFTSPIGLPVSQVRVWHAGGTVPGADGGVPGQELQRAYGNPSRMGYQANVSKRPYGGGENNDPVSQFGMPRPLQQGQENAVRSPGNAPVGYSNDKLTTYDRHGMMKVGYENSGRESGNVDQPVQGGPARPSLWLVQRSLSYQQGTDTTAATDDLARAYSRNAQGMYVAEQGSGWSPVYGGTPGLFQLYGSYQGVAPDSPGYDPVAGVSEGIISPVQKGNPGDGPQTVWSGPPHGLHSPTLPIYSQTLGRYMSIPQQSAPRIDRPSNSPIAGQSFSQLVQPQGQTGTYAQNTRRMSGVQFARGTGQVSFGTSAGWRGQAGV